MAKESGSSESSRKRKHDADGKSDGAIKKKSKPKDAQIAEGKPSKGIFGDPSAAYDPTLSSLFAASAPVNGSMVSRVASKPTRPSKKASQTRQALVDQAQPDDEASDAVDTATGEDLSSLSSDEEGNEIPSSFGNGESEEAEVDEDELEIAPQDVDRDAQLTVSRLDEPAETKAKRRKRRGDAEDDLEVQHLNKLARESAREDRKREKPLAHGLTTTETTNVDVSASASDSEAEGDDADDVDAPPPMHESLMPKTDEEMEKAQRTVFLGNVANEAVKSKTARRTLEAHLKSFFTSLKTEADQPSPSLVSIRFRSTAFASAIPKRAAATRGEVMDATAHATNAYAVYSSPTLAREAARRLNGTVVLDRHLRVDSVAHPAKVDHHRCIFVGNLGFVEDESNIDAADEEAGRAKRKGRKVPSDTEEGLWRTFGKCGTVESVRVPRDAKTRVGKGFAYVQFTDENAVEAALLLNEKKFPPMLPRKLRITRARAQKRNKKFNDGPSRDGKGREVKRGGYVPKFTPQQKSQMGRAAKLLGKGGMRSMQREGRGEVMDRKPIQDPESFVFEGNRAKSGGATGLKMKKGPKKRMPTKSSGKRAAAFKSKSKEKVA